MWPHFFDIPPIDDALNLAIVSGDDGEVRRVLESSTARFDKQHLNESIEVVESDNRLCLDGRHDRDIEIVRLVAQAVVERFNSVEAKKIFNDARTTVAIILEPSSNEPPKTNTCDWRTQLQKDMEQIISIIEAAESQIPTQPASLDTGTAFGSEFILT